MRMIKPNNNARTNAGVYVADKSTQCKCVYFKEWPDLVQEDE